MLAAALLLLAPSAAAAEEEAVLAVVDRFFETYYARDVAGMQATLAPGARGQGVTIGAGGMPESATPPLDMDAWATRLETLTTRNNEIYWEPEVRIRAGGVAQFWAPYIIEIDGVPSHCGIDAFTLVKLDGAWKLSSLEFTMEPGGCDALGYRPDREGMRPASLVPHLSGN